MSTVLNLGVIQSTAEAREKGRRGGIASGLARRAQKTQRARLSQMLGMICTCDTLGSLKKLGLIEDGQIVDNETLLDVVLFQQAMKGDLPSIKYIHERMGMSPRLLRKEHELYR